MELEKKVTIDKIIYWILNAIVLMYGISLAYLFYKQTQWVDGSVYESDLPAHIKMVIEDGWYYSLTALIYKLLYILPNGNAAISLFLAFCSLASVYMTALLLKQITVMNELPVGILGVSESRVTPHLLKEEKVFCESLFLALGIALNFVMSCYVRGVSDGRYIGMQSASIWHNSTYIVMKCLALGCILMYFKIHRIYADQMTIWQWVGFTLLLAITTGVKPSFLFAFAPAMALSLLYDLLHGIAFRKIVMWGCTVVPALLVILVQNAVLFGGTTGNSMALIPGYAMSIHSSHLWIAAALSILFPLCVLIWNLKELKKDYWYAFSWLVALVGFAEYFLITETGNRASDGNFSWGYAFAILLLFIVSVIKWLQNLCSYQKEKKKMELAYLMITALIFGYHLYCGVDFYMKLVQGVSYWMWAM